MATTIKERMREFPEALGSGPTYRALPTHTLPNFISRLITCAFRSILVAQCGFYEGTACRHTFGMGCELLRHICSYCAEHTRIRTRVSVHGDRHPEGFSSCCN